MDGCRKEAAQGEEVQERLEAGGLGLRGAQGHPGGTGTSPGAARCLLSGVSGVWSLHRARAPRLSPVGVTGTSTWGCAGQEPLLVLLLDMAE